MVETDESDPPDGPGPAGPADGSSAETGADPRAQADLDVLVIGPAGRDTGGIAQYIAAQQTHLGDVVDFRVYDVAAEAGTGVRRFLRAAMFALLDVLLFPIRVHERPDVVHVHTSHRRSFYQSACYVLLARARGWPIVLHVHGSSFDSFVHDTTLPVRLLQRAVFGACEGVVVLADSWADVLSERVPEDDIAILPNAIDVDAYDPDPGADPLRVAFISDHIRRKGVHTLVDAIEQVLDGPGTGGATAEADASPVGDGGATPDEPPLRVDIAGIGPLSEESATLADRYEAVEYHGYVSESRKRDLLTEASVFVLPTHAEGLPIAILEAMAGGNAILTTDVGAIGSVVDDDTGLLVAPESPDQFAEALEELLAHPGRVRSMGERSRRRAAAGYDWEEISERLLRLYGRVAEDRPVGQQPLTSTQ